MSQGGAAAGLATAVVQRKSAQPTRRAVLCAQAPGDPVAPADLASWFTERAFHFYVARLRVPATAALTGRRARHDLVPAFADLDAACRRLREADGMASVLVTAHGRAAVAAALWSDSRQQVGDGQPGGSARADGRAAAGERSDQSGADALILSAPAWPKASLRLHIACPVLVLAGQNAARTGSRPWPHRSRGRGAPPLQLGSHVTWLALADASADRRRFLDELGRWLGAYMYGPLHDQLL